MRWVVKVGSAVLTDSSFYPREEIFSSLAEEIAFLMEREVEVVLVTSGAIASGFPALKYSSPPETLPERQACAAVGQISLMERYRRAFFPYGIPVGQILLTHEDFRIRQRYLHARNTLMTLLSHRVLPIVNENDAVAVEEILVGDNDQLAVMVAGMVSAERLVFLTSVDGVYDGDPSLPSSKKVPEIPSPSALRRYLPQGKSLLGRGGIHGKLLAGEKAQKLGIETIIASGNEKNVLIRLFQGEKVGSRIPGSSHPIKARKFWIRYALHPKGEIVVDKGAEIALRERGKSLLPSGVLDVHGSFSPGDPVRIVSVEGNPVAYGIVEYGAEEIRKIQGKKTREIVPILGYKRTDEIVHRDDLVLEKDSTDPVAITS